MRRLKNYRAETSSDAKTEADDLAAKYSGKSENELMQELLKNVARAKGDGTFSSEQLREFIEFVSPNLDEKSRTRLGELVGMINGESADNS